MPDKEMFAHYAKYYNLLYEEKRYSEEAKHVDELIRKYAQLTKTETILDIGCGTGRHAEELVKMGYKVTGIDQSQQMIASACERNIENANFQVGDANNFKLNKKYDAVTSLFHVISYLTSNDSLLATLNNIAEHLNNNGLLIFDFWYGPAVLTERPTTRIKRLENKEISVLRISEPTIHLQRNVVDVNFEVHITDKSDDYVTKVKELHPMRYFTTPEIELLLVATGFNLLSCKEWMTEKAPDDTTWGVCCVAVKK